MKNVHNEHRLNLDANDLINKTSDSILVRNNTKEKNHEPIHSSRVVLQQVGLASTTSDEDKSLISNENSHGSAHN